MDFRSPALCSTVWTLAAPLALLPQLRWNASTYATLGAFHHALPAKGNPSPPSYPRCSKKALSCAPHAGLTHTHPATADGHASRHPLTMEVAVSLKTSAMTTRKLKALCRSQ